MTQKDQFVFLFGGMGAGDIFVIDLNAMTIKESLIKCPDEWWSFRSFIMNDGDKQKLMAHGFIRRCYQSKTI